VARPLIARGVEREAARATSGDLLRRLALPADLLDGYPVLFSGGEQQRVNIARALIALPRLLLLDEPTSALDAANQATVIELLRDAHAAGTTIIGIFHDLAVMHQLADAYLLLRDGRVIESGADLAEAGLLVARS
jgi:alpha-D-ribose 1-methylphosphonate 5-triphosphate synthase subunit PhnL